MLPTSYNDHNLMVIQVRSFKSVYEVQMQIHKDRKSFITKSHSIMFHSSLTDRVYDKDKVQTKLDIQKRI